MIPLSIYSVHFSWDVGRKWNGRDHLDTDYEFVEKDEVGGGMLNLNLLSACSYFLFLSFALSCPFYFPSDGVGISTRVIIPAPLCYSGAIFLAQLHN